MSVARRRACGASSGQTTSVPGSVRVKDKQAKGHVKCTTDSLAVLATSLQRRRAASNVQRATCNPRQRATVAAKYFYLYFIAPVEQLQFICPVLAQASPAGQTQSASVLQQLLPFLLLLLTLCSAALYGAPPDAVYVFSFILSPQLGLGLPALAINSSSTQLKGRRGGGGGRRECRRYCINYDLVDLYDKP